MDVSGALWREQREPGRVAYDHGCGKRTARRDCTGVRTPGARRVPVGRDDDSRVAVASGLGEAEARNLAADFGEASDMRPGSEEAVDALGDVDLLGRSRGRR